MAVGPDLVVLRLLEAARRSEPRDSQSARGRSPPHPSQAPKHYSLKGSSILTGRFLEGLGPERPSHQAPGRLLLEALGPPFGNIITLGALV